MKKIKLLAVAAAVVALAAFVLVGCASSGGSASNSASASGSAASASASAASSDASAGAVKLVVGFDAQYPPYGFKAADGSYTGFDLDLAQAVAEMNGWEFEAKPIDWDTKDLELDSGNITCIWNGFTYEGREDQYAWSEPYMLNAQVYVVAKDSSIASYEDMEGAKVVTQAGSAAYTLLTADEEHEPLQTKFDGGEVATVPDYNTAFMQLDSGAVEVVACDLSIANYHMAQDPDKFVQLDEPLNSEHYAVGFKLGEEATAATVTESLKKLYADGTVAQLIEKYSDYGMVIEDWVLK